MFRDVWLLLPLSRPAWTATAAMVQYAPPTAPPLTDTQISRRANDFKTMSERVLPLEARISNSTGSYGVGALFGAVL